jgi:hypothetical protein
MNKDDDIDLQTLYDLQVKELLNTWDFLHCSYPETKKYKFFHRTIIQDVKYIDEIKKILIQKIGYLPIHIFLTDYFYKIELPGPYRHIEKGLLLLFHIVSGLSINKMDKYIPYTNFFKIYKRFYVKHKKDLSEWINKMLNKDFFTNYIIRILSAKINNPLKIKNVTCFIDGYDSRVSYQDIHFDKKRMYSYKFKNDGYRTQFLIDINNFIIHISESVPCSDKTDGVMMEEMLLYKYVNMGDCILVDGGYTLHIPNTIDKINAKGYNIDIESFAFPFRKPIGEDLSVQQALFNKQINSLRSSIETFFHHFTNDFERFNKHNIIRITEKSLYNLQLNFAAVIFNLKNSCKVYDAGNDIYKDIYKNWTEKNFEYKYENDEVVEEVFRLDNAIMYKQEYINNKNFYQNNLINNLKAKFNKLNIQNDNDYDMGIDNDEINDVYEIEKIMCHKKEKDSYIYLVKWLNYDETTWVKESEFMQKYCIEHYWTEFNKDL